MFDVFYLNKKPNLFRHERQVSSMEQACQLSKTRYFWLIDYLSDYTGWDWLWEPPPWQAHQRHAWPDQHQPDSGTYLIPKSGYTETNYHSDRYIHRLPDSSCWHIPDWIDPESIDRRWSPDPQDPPYIYEFPVEWGWDAIGGPQYRVPGAREIKYVHDWQARTRPDPDRFEIRDRIAPDDPVMRWRPNPTEPPYIYVFGNQWYPAEVRESARYTVPGAQEFKYVEDVRCQRLPDAAGFEFLYPADFDCSWEPDPGSPPYIYVFGNQYYPAEVMPTVRYHVPGAAEEKFMDVQAHLQPDTTGPWQMLMPCDWDYTWRPEPGSPAYIYVFGNQWWPAEKMPTVEYHMPGATERKYMPGPVAHLPVDMTYWHIPTGVDTRDMDFSWVPDPGEPPYIYQFATQHQKTGGPQYRVPGAEEIKYLDMMRAAVTGEAVPIVEIDHMDGNAGQIDHVIKRVRYFDNYRDTLIRIARNLEGKHEHVWVCSSICDYTDFDFSWHPETWQSTMLHVFASDDQKFGDTFYMHVPTFADRAERKALLEWTSVNYVPRRSVPRRPMPMVMHKEDSHVDPIKNYPGSAPLTLFTNSDVPDRKVPAVSLWRDVTKTVTPLDPGGSVVIVPKAAASMIQTQIYDYPHIDKSYRSWSLAPLQDVIFISYDEPEAEKNWEKLKSRCARAQRVHGVDGMEKALEAAAELSATPWYFAVFAKTVLHETWDFTFSPDYFQAPKHYIFYSHNRVNDLEYGEMAIIMYNRHMVLDARGREFGLDYTLSFPHQVVPIISTYGNFDTSPYHAWRTAFREVSKLYDFNSREPSIETQHRIHVWETKARGEYAEWVLKGARDGKDFYQTYAHDFAYRKNSFNWKWLRHYFVTRYGNVS